MTAREKQIGGDHYRKLAIQPIDYIVANKLGFMEGSIVQYITRWHDKGGVEDLRKARHMLDMLIENQPLTKETTDARDDRSAV